MYSDTLGNRPQQYILTGKYVLFELEQNESKPIREGRLFSWQHIDNVQSHSNPFPNSRIYLPLSAIQRKRTMVPKFLLGDNTDFPDAIFIVHTEFPRFVLNLENDEVEWFDDISGEDKDDVTSEVSTLIEEAEEFYQREVDRYQQNS